MQGPGPVDDSSFWAPHSKPIPASGLMTQRQATEIKSYKSLSSHLPHIQNFAMQGFPWMVCYIYVWKFAEVERRVLPGAVFRLLPNLSESKLRPVSLAQLWNNLLLNQLLSPCPHPSALASLVSSHRKKSAADRALDRWPLLRRYSQWEEHRHQITIARC